MDTDVFHSITIQENVDGISNGFVPGKDAGKFCCCYGIIVIIVSILP